MLKLLPQVMAGLFPVPLPNLAMIQQSLQNLGTRKDSETMKPSQISHETGEMFFEDIFRRDFPAFELLIQYTIGLVPFCTT